MKMDGGGNICFYKYLARCTHGDNLNRYHEPESGKPSNKNSEVI